MTKKRIPVSVIIPCYRAADVLPRAVQSVITQTVLPTEIMLINDASPDEGKTLETMQAIKHTYDKIVSVCLINLPVNQGVASARNKGMEKASQPYIAFLDDDDIWHPQKLEIQYGYMSEHQEVYLTCHHSCLLRNGAEKQQFCDSNITLNQKIVKINPKKLLFLHYTNGATSSVMLKHDRQLRFKDGKRYSEDYLLWLDYTFVHDGALLDVTLVGKFKEIYGAGGLSGNLWALEKGELDTYRQVALKNYTNRGVVALAMWFSVLKFLRRCLVCALRSRREEKNDGT